jgi:6-phosphofructokinase 1
MGHRAGWLALGAGIAGGADVILIPEIPYDLECVADAIRERVRGGKRFSIVAVAEGALPIESAKSVIAAENQKQQATTKEDKKAAKEELIRLEALHANHTMELAKRLEELTGQETRVTILGHLQRGGAPSAADRLLATRLGSACADLINDGVFGVMVAARGEGTEPVLLEDVAGVKKLVPKDHPWVLSAKHVGTNLGDE